MILDKAITDMVRRKYATKWEKTFEQTMERIKPYTTVESDIGSDTGVYYEFPWYGGTNMREYTGSRKTVEIDQLAYGKRGMCYRQFYNAIDLSINEVDDLGTLDMNFSMIMERQRAAAARMMDEIALGVVKDANTGKYRLKTSSDGGFVGGILGTNYGGENGAATHELDLTLASWQAGTGNLIPSDYATTGTGVSQNFAGTILDKINYIKRKFEEMNVYNPTDKGEICIAISPAVKQMLMAMETRIMRDYGFSKLGDAGSCSYNSSMNMNFLVTNMLPTFNAPNIAGGTDTGARMCCAWLKSRIKFGNWRQTEFTLKDVNDKVDVDHYVRVRGKAGCGRMDEDTVFVLPVIETA